VLKVKTHTIRYKLRLFCRGVFKEKVARDETTGEKAKVRQGKDIRERVGNLMSSLFLKIFGKEKDGTFIPFHTSIHFI